MGAEGHLGKAGIQAMNAEHAVRASGPVRAGVPSAAEGPPPDLRCPASGETMCL